MKPRPLVLAVCSLVLVGAPAPGEIIERVVARVNGDIVTLSEFVARQAAAVQGARVRPAETERFLRENNARILQEAIDDLLLVQRAEELGIRLRPEYVREVIDGIRKENAIESEEALQEQLRREGMSLEDLKRNIERSILRRQVLARELESKAAVSEAEARSDYEAHLADHTRPATVRIQEILVKAGEEDALAAARDVVARGRAGEDFAALARERSAAPSRDSGGELGTFARGELTPQIEAIAFALAAGEVSDALQTPDGVRILRVAEKTEAHVVPFEEARNEILRRLSQERGAKEYETYIEGLRKTAVIDVRVREVPLQVSVPTPVTPAPEGTVPPAGAPPSDAPEFTTTPQAQPERVVPPALPGERAPGAQEPREKEKEPAPTPSPTPTPPPS